MSRTSPLIVLLRTSWLLEIGAYLHIQCRVDHPSLSLQLGSICSWIIRCLKIFKPWVDLEELNHLLNIIIWARLIDGWNYETNPYVSSWNTIPTGKGIAYTYEHSWHKLVMHDIMYVLNRLWLKVICFISWSLAITSALITWHIHKGIIVLNRFGPNLSTEAGSWYASGFEKWAHFM